MNCLQTRARIHDYMDRELPVAEMMAVGNHLDACGPCRQVHQDLSRIREYLALPERLPQLTGQELWRRIERRTGRTLKTRLAEGWHSLCGLWRELDRRMLWSRIGAVPVTTGFFMLILAQFLGGDFLEWNSPVLTQALTRTASASHVVSVPVRMGRAQIEDLVSEIWKMPFEDSLSLLAEITPEGHAEIGDILEYPRSQNLLRAVDLSLRESRFGKAVGSDGDSVMIYSFQKVDVYEGY